MHAAQGVVVFLQVTGHAIPLEAFTLKSIPFPSAIFPCNLAFFMLLVSVPGDENLRPSGFCLSRTRNTFPFVGNSQEKMENSEVDKLLPDSALTVVIWKALSHR